ncbi:ATP-binding protein [Halalkalibacter wakoensis JCM 9140]|uniref:ATP-binding protein n=1 Tax=Halalkalibacter wakoensis JCM 9140 TaxID=1236970 RepID=W4Q6E8_9BACI|nr:DUF87 domain-containing protein [Halalkalibacter wakoensis]GAE27530.1 ATP-binding protein [Halalkalibacter wakoensis JCM 9140]
MDSLKFTEPHVLQTVLAEANDFFTQDTISQLNIQHLTRDFIDLKDCCFFKLKSLTYDDKVPYREAFENVISTLEDPAFNFVYLLSGSTTGIEIYLGIVRNYQAQPKHYDTAVKLGRLIESAFNGNFQGSSLQKLDRNEIRDSIIEPLKNVRRGSLITGIPSINSVFKEKNLDFQGIDRLINGMSGGDWKLLIVSERVETAKVGQLKDAIYELYEQLHRYAKISYQRSDNTSLGHSDSDTKGSSNQKSKGTNESRTDASGETKSKKDGALSTNKNLSTAKGTSQGITEGTSQSKTSGTTITDGKSNAYTLEIVNKRTQEVMKYVDEELLERLKVGSSKGLFKASIYVLGENREQHDRLRSSILSIFQGDKSNYSPLHARKFAELYSSKLPKLVSHFQNYTTNDPLRKEITLLHGIPHEENESIGISTYMTAREISLIAGLPQKEVPGLPLKEGVEFGLNVLDGNERDIELGSVLQRGQRLDEYCFHLSKKNLNKHIFIAGVTGSGKTTTCQKILIESNLPFMVIEPAKTEYRGLYGQQGMDDLMLFTLGNEKLAPFRLNPFELLEGESVTSHVDMLKATFTAAFPMEAAMPQILESAIYECYEMYGWNFCDNTNKYSDHPWQAEGKFFPTLTDLVEKIKDVVHKQGFGIELRDNYIGSLVSRISNLTVGAKGQMLNCRTSIDFFQLINKKVILEMEEVRSPEDKALLMGLILSRLSEAIKLRYKKDKHFKHLTLVEEAHRLLSKVEIGDHGSKKAAVEMFSDMLAEVRKYGEGLIIADQIPNKLAIEVLKNTNTKIIHRLFAKDDKEAIGDTMLMDEKQKQFLSSLHVGEAIVFTEGLYKPMHIHVQRKTDTENNELEDETIRQIGHKQINDYKTSFHPLASRLGLMIEQFKLLDELYDKLSVILSKVKLNKLSDEEWHAFNDEVTSLANMLILSSEGLWQELIRQYLLNNGFLRENDFNESLIIESYMWFYEQANSGYSSIDRQDIRFTIL